MSKPSLNAFALGLIGGLVAVLLLSALPAVAGDGDDLVLGEKNSAKTVTRLNTRGGYRIDSFKNGNPALILNVADSSSAPMEVNASGLVDNLNADMVDGFEASSLVRASFEAVNDVVDADGDALTVEITAPVAGVLLLAGGVDAGGAGHDTFTCSLQLNGNPVDGTLRRMTVDYEGVGHTGNTEEDCSTTGAVMVAPGEHTVVLFINQRTNVSFSQGSLWVLFVPFNGNGTQAVPVDQ